jgi:hypothetical protein
MTCIVLLVVCIWVIGLERPNALHLLNTLIRDVLRVTCYVLHVTSVFLYCGFLLLSKK